MDSIDQRILHLMHEGLTDEAIARRLHLGHRTVQRRIELLMEAFAVTSRFSLGATAERLGLLEREVVSEQGRSAFGIDKRDAA
ncbi:helix-turn-helix domain-containing protein [Streptomyces phaeochromogenes]